MAAQRIFLAIVLVTVMAAAATTAAAQVPRGETVRSSETAIDECAKVFERVLANAGTSVHVVGAGTNPVVGDISVIGAKRAVRTPEALIVERTGLVTGEPLTNAVLRRAARRVLDLPVAACGWIRFAPQEDGRAKITVGIHERPIFPTKPASWGQIGGRALIMREIEVPFGAPTGHGERVDLVYGFKKERPRTAIRLTTPAPGPIPGLAVVEFSWNRQAVAGGDSASSEIFREERQSIRVGLEDWLTERVHWHVDGTYDRLEHHPFVALGGGLDTRWVGDHVAVRFESTSWRGLDDSPAFRSGSFSTHWRQEVAAIPTGWSAEAGVVAASADTPVILWSGADAGASRQAFLRAHKLFTSGVIRSEVFGRRLTYGSVAYERPVATTKFVTVGVVGFIDTAKALHGLISEASPAHVDVGVGARFHASSFGSIRLDVGYGLRDGTVAVSAGFSRPWPRR